VSRPTVDRNGIPEWLPPGVQDTRYLGEIAAQLGQLAAELREIKVEAMRYVALQERHSQPIQADSADGMLAALAVSALSRKIEDCDSRGLTIRARKTLAKLSHDGGTLADVTELNCRAKRNCGVSTWNEIRLWKESVLRPK
jgi:hypothetical protein